MSTEIKSEIEAPEATRAENQAAADSPTEALQPAASAAEEKVTISTPSKYFRIPPFVTIEHEHGHKFTISVNEVCYIDHSSNQVHMRTGILGIAYGGKSPRMVAQLLAAMKERHLV